MQSRIDERDRCERIELSKVAVVAHRGDPSAAPENTLPAIQRAVTLGVDMIEFDVQLTKDENLVLMHDDTVDRTTNGNGRVHGLTLAKIKELRAFSSGVTDEKRKSVSIRFDTGVEVPTLEEVLGIVPPTIQLNIHLKSFEPSLMSLTEDKVIAHVSKNGHLRGRSFLATDTIESLGSIRRKDSAINCILLARQDNPRDYVEQCRKFGLKLLQPSREIITREFMDQIHVEAMKAYVFWADSEEDMNLFISRDVDGILTNFPQRLMKILNKC